MPNQTPSLVAPSINSWLGIARETTAGTPVLPANTIPLLENDYNPEDTPKFLPDEAIRGVMATRYNTILGPEDATFSFGGPAFLDTEGFWLDNAMGDLSSTSNGTLGTAQPLSAPLAAGATSLTVATSLGTVNTGSVIAIVDGAKSEIVIATTGSTGTIVDFTNTPCRFAHTTSATAALETAATTYTHKFSLLNSGSGQPPTHTLTDYTSLTATVGARAYPSACVSQVDFTGNTEQLLMAKVAGNSWLSAPAASPPANTTSFVAPVAAWTSTVSVGGSPVYDITEWTFSLKRKLQVYWTAQDNQTPYVIARGGLDVMGGLNYGVATGESPLTQMLAGTPVAVAVTISNGLTGAGELSLTLTATSSVFVKAKPVRNSVLIGYDDSFECNANTTDVGGSAGLGPATVTLINSVAAY